jgi:hypothetical protein
VAQAHHDAGVEARHPGGGERGENAQFPCCRPGPGRATGAAVNAGTEAREQARDREQRQGRGGVPEGLPGEHRVVEQQLAHGDGTADQHHPEDTQSDGHASTLWFMWSTGQVHLTVV